MKIESRVERLEHELKILKNEIQQTLLDIQEQVLIHYYPTLRAEEEGRGDSRPTPPRLSARQKAAEKRTNGNHSLNALETLDLDNILIGEEEPAFEDEPAPRTPRRNGVQGPLRSDREHFSLQDPYDVEEDEESENFSPHLREISMEDIRHREPSPRTQPKAGQLASRKQFALLADWVETSVGAVGKERAKRALEAYASGGYLPDEARNLIVRLIELSEEPEEVDSTGAGNTFEILTKLDNILGQEE